MGQKNPGQIRKDPGFGQDLTQDLGQIPDLFGFGQDFFDQYVIRKTQIRWNSFIVFGVYL